MVNKKNETKNIKKNKIEKVENIKETKKTAKKDKEKTKKVNKKKDNNNENLFKFFEFFDKYRLAIYGVVGGILATLLVVILIWPDRIAKLENGKEPVAQIKGYTVTADELYEDMKKIYSVSTLLDKIDNKILTEKYPENDEMKDEIKKEAENYYNVYEQYYGYTKEEFLYNNGFASETAFLEYLKLQYRRNEYFDNYTKSLVTEKEIEKYYKKEVYGDINTKHILVKVNSDATDEEKENAEKLAKEIITKLNKGKTFDEVKEEYADKITYEELGYKSYNASLESAYMEEMENLKNNSYSKKPVKTSYGYHVVYRIDQKEKPSLEEAKEEIIETLAKEKASKNENLYYTCLDKMRTEAGIIFQDTVLEEKYKTYMKQYK